jgi:hypothetical protein
MSSVSPSPTAVGPPRVTLPFALRRWCEAMLSAFGAGVEWLAEHLIVTSASFLTHSPREVGIGRLSLLTLG